MRGGEKGANWGSTSAPSTEENGFNSGGTAAVGELTSVISEMGERGPLIMYPLEDSASTNESGVDGMQRNDKLTNNQSKYVQYVQENMPKTRLFFVRIIDHPHSHVWGGVQPSSVVERENKKINTRDKKDQVKSARSLSSTPTELSSTSQEAW